jgi:hypothetical protein
MKLICRDCETYYDSLEDCCPDCGGYKAAPAEEDCGWGEIG